MKEIHITAEGDKDSNARYVHVFRLEDGSLDEEECSMEEYKSLAKSKEYNPKRDGKTWLYSYADNRYDTVSGKLEAETFVQLGERYLMNKDGKIESSTARPE